VKERKNGDRQEKGTQEDPSIVKRRRQGGNGEESRRTNGLTRAIEGRAREQLKAGRGGSDGEVRNVWKLV